MLLERASQIVNATDLSRKTRELLDALVGGRKRKLVVMRDNMPTAVLLSVKEYEAQQDELNDLRIEAVARQRLAGFERGQALTHAEILAEFVDDA